MRRAAAALLAPFWTVGALVAAAWSLTRWAGAAAADGYTTTLKWKHAPIVGACLLAAAAITGVVWAL